MAEKKKKGRRAYLDSFKKKSDGTYVYEGESYVYEGDDLRAETARIVRLGAVMLAAVIAAGCVDAPGTGGSVYVLLPYAAGLVACISVCWGIGRLAAGGDPLRAYIYQATVRQIPGRAVFAAVCVSAAIVGEIVFLCRNGADGKWIGGAAFFLLEAFALVLAVCVYKCVSRMRWSRREAA